MGESLRIIDARLDLALVAEISERSGFRGVRKLQILSFGCTDTSEEVVEDMEVSFGGRHLCNSRPFKSVVQEGGSDQSGVCGVLEFGHHSGSRGLG